MINLGTNPASMALKNASPQLGGPPLSSPTSAANQERAAAAAKDFEAVFLAEMLKPMFETVEVDDTFGGGHGEEVFRGLMVQEYGKMLSQKGGIGLATHIQAQLLKLQEKGTAS